MKIGWRKWLKRLVLAGLAAGILALVLHPWLMAWVAGLAGGQFGAARESSRVDGYSAIVWQGVTWKDEALGLDVSAKEVRVALPFPWLAAIAFGDAEDETRVLTLSGWRVAVTPVETPEPEPAPDDGPLNVPETVQTVDGLVDMAARYAPRVSADDGEVTVAGNTLRVAALEWNRGALAVDAEWVEQGLTATLGGASWKSLALAASLPNRPDAVKLDIVCTPEAGALAVTATGVVAGASLNAACQYAEAGLIPETVDLELEGKNLLPELLAEYFVDHADATITADWENGAGRFDLNLAADIRREIIPEGAPRFKTESARVAIAASGKGDFSQADIAAFSLRSPVLELTTGSLAVDLEALTLKNPFTFSLQLDSAAWEQDYLEGILEVAGDISPDGKNAANGLPIFDFTVDGKRRLPSQDDAPAIALTGRFDGQLLDLREIAAELPDLLAAKGQAKLDIEAGAILSSNLTATLPAAVIARFLPEGMETSEIVVEATANGPFTAVEHAGTVGISRFDAPPAEVLSLETKWSGLGGEKAALALAVTGPRASLDLAGDFAMGDDFRFDLTGFTLKENTGGVLYQLTEPATAVFQPGPDGTWSARLDGLRGKGLAPVTYAPAPLPPPVLPPPAAQDPAAATEAPAVDEPPAIAGTPAVIETPAVAQTPVPDEISAAIPEAPPLPTPTAPVLGPMGLELQANVVSNGSIEVVLSAENLTTALASLWLRDPLPPVQIPSLKVTASRSNPAQPLTWSIRAEAGTDLPEIGFVAFSAEAANRDGVIKLTRVEAASGGTAFLTASGEIPFSAQLAEDFAFTWDLPQDKPLSLRANLRPHTVVTGLVARNSPATIVEPSAKLDFSGSLKAPAGTFSLTVKSVDTGSEMDGKPIVLEQVSVKGKISEAEVALTKAGLSFLGNPVVIDGGYPMGAETWENLLAGAFAFDKEKARASVRVDGLAFAPMAEQFPTFFARSGKVSASVNLSPGMALSGNVKLVDANLRPLATGVTVTGINAGLRFENRDVFLENTHALLGGEKIALTGSGSWLGGDTFTCDIAIKGDNLPLVKQEDLVFRAGLDIHIKKTPDAPGLISGTVTPRDSLLLKDLRGLTKKGTASPLTRPPFFSVDAEPVADWKLDIAVRGEEFMKVDMPVFKGRVSADLKLGGTLAEPVAIGQAELPSGALPFPFGTLKLKSGAVRLLQANPYEPELEIEAAGRSYGYDLDMTVTGPASDPVVRLSSNPPLTEEAIILLLTAGVIPENEMGSSKRTSRMAMYMGKGLFGGLFSSGAGADRLSIESGGDISREGKETMRAEYRLKDNLSVVGEYDEYDAYNADLKFRIFSK